MLNVLPDKPAAAAGLMSGDKVLSIAGSEVHTWAGLVAAVSAHGGDAVEVVIQRADNEVRVTVTPTGGRGDGRIGIAPEGWIVEEVSLGAALVEGLSAPGGLLMQQAE